MTKVELIIFGKLWVCTVYCTVQCRNYSIKAKMNHDNNALSGVKRFDILTLIFMTYFTLLKVYRWSWCRKFPYWKRPSWFISLNIIFHFHPMNAQNPPPSHLFVQVQKDQYHELLCDMVSFYISMTFHLFLYIFNKSFFFIRTPNR